MKAAQLLALVVFAGAVPPAFAQAPSLPQPGSVFLEELTWMEVRDAIAAGKTTVIIPTGGTEQNGPHLVLGKHNYPRQVQSRRDRGAPRERARRAGRGVRARRGRRSADRPHALRRHHHDTAGRVRQGARVCGAKLQAARFPRCRADRRQRRQSGRAAARRGGAEQGMGGRRRCASITSPRITLDAATTGSSARASAPRMSARTPARTIREPDVHQSVDAAIRQDGRGQSRVTARGTSATRRKRPRSSAGVFSRCRSRTRRRRFGSLRVSSRRRAELRLTRVSIAVSMRLSTQSHSSCSAWSQHAQ